MQASHASAAGRTVLCQGPLRAARLACARPAAPRSLLYRGLAAPTQQQQQQQHLSSPLQVCLKPLSPLLLLQLQLLQLRLSMPLSSERNVLTPRVTQCQPGRCRTAVDGPYNHPCMSLTAGGLTHRPSHPACLHPAACSSSCRRPSGGYLLAHLALAQRLHLLGMEQHQQRAPSPSTGSCPCTCSSGGSLWWA